MRVQMRHLQPGEANLELVLLFATAVPAAAAALWLTLRLPWPVCAFRELTGHPCATCGATRAGLALLHGHPGAAWHFNPLVAVVLCGIALFDLYALGVLASGARRVRVGLTNRATQKWMVAAGAALVLLNWIYLLRTY